MKSTTAGMSGGWHAQTFSFELEIQLQPTDFKPKESNLARALAPEITAFKR